MVHVYVASAFLSSMRRLARQLFGYQRTPESEDPRPRDVRGSGVLAPGGVSDPRVPRPWCRNETSFVAKLNLATTRLTETIARCSARRACEGAENASPSENAIGRSAIYARTAAITNGCISSYTQAPP